MSSNQPVIINIDNVSIHYDEVKAINGLTTQLMRGEVLSLLGENGAGKSSLINAVLGRIPVNSGHISVFGEAPGSQCAKLRIGTILQSANLSDNVTVLEQLNLFRSYYQHPRPLQELIDIAMLAEFVDQRMVRLSGGQKQRVFFALAICGNPDVIFLDEPTVGLDTLARKEFWQCIHNIKTQGVAMVLTTHYLEEAEALSDRVLLLDHGDKRWEGTPAQLKSNSFGKKVSFQWHQSITDFSRLLTQLDIVAKTAQLTLQDNRIAFLCPLPEEILPALFQSNISCQDLVIETAKFEDAVLAMSQTSPVTQNKQQEIAA